MESAEVVSERACVDPKPVKINVLMKYVELLRDDIQQKVYGLIKVREKSKPETKNKGACQ